MNKEYFEESDVVYLISKGFKNAISIKEIRKKCNLSNEITDERIKKTIQLSCIKYKIPISCHRGKYFIPTTEEMNKYPPVVFTDEVTYRGN